MPETTLQKMAPGGIFDPLGGGFHRYSVDRVWLVPHFKKTLYDNTLQIQEQMPDLFQEKERGFFFTSRYHTDPAARMKKPYDGPVPSGNSVVSQNLLCLAAYTGDTGYRNIAEKALPFFHDAMRKSPSGTMGLHPALLRFTAEESTIIVSGDPEWESTRSLLSELKSRPDFQTVTGLGSPHMDESDLERFPVFRDKKAEGDQALIYVCRGSTCLPPVREVEGMDALMK
jgi:uncharacterized protein YyaL (SSP411 family)